MSALMKQAVEEKRERSEELVILWGRPCSDIHLLICTKDEEVKDNIIVEAHSSVRSGCDTWTTRP